MKRIIITTFPAALEAVYRALNSGAKHLTIGLLTKGKQACRKTYDLRDCLHFVEDVTRMAGGRATISWGTSMHDMLGCEYGNVLK